jgi:hypothetical protein
MLYVPVENVPTALKESIARTGGENRNAFEALVEELPRAQRARQTAREDQICMELAKHLDLCPSNLAAHIVGGSCGVVGVPKS